MCSNQCPAYPLQGSVGGRVVGGRYSGGSVLGGKRGGGGYFITIQELG